MYSPPWKFIQIEPKERSAASALSAYRRAVLLCLEEHQRGEGGAWKVTAVRKAEPSAGGAVNLSLVLCSGDVCRMMRFQVGADDEVTEVC